MDQNNEHIQQSIHLRQSPVILVMRLITVELIIFILHSLFKVVIVQIEQYVGSDIYGMIGIVEIIVLQILNIGLILQIIFSWLNTTYIINPREVIFSTGFVSRVSTTYEFANLQSMNVSQSVWGRLFNFGSIRLFNPVLKEEVTLDLIPNPDQVGRFIQQFQPEITPLIKRQKN